MLSTTPESGRGHLSRRSARQRRRDMIRRGRAEARQLLADDRRAAQLAEQYLQDYEDSLGAPRRNPDGSWGVR